MRHYRIKIHGQVQAVGFRFSVKQLADQLGLAGFVRNEPDGTVLIEVKGDKKKVEQLIAWCRKGPSWAQIDKVEVRRLKADQQFDDFNVIHSQRP